MLHIYQILLDSTFTVILKLFTRQNQLKRNLNQKGKVNEKFNEKSLMKR